MTPHQACDLEHCNAGKAAARILINAQADGAEISHALHFINATYGGGGVREEDDDNGGDEDDENEDLDASESEDELDSARKPDRTH